MYLALAFISWLVFSVLEGRREALYFSYKMRASIAKQQAFKKDEHILFSWQRLAVLCGMIIPMGVCLNTLIAATAFCMAFPFLHDGMYYVTRNQLDGIYPKRWFDQSTTSTALSDRLKLFNPVTRTALFGVSVLLQTYLILKF